MNPSETLELLALKLAAIGRERTTITARLDELVTEEQRLRITQDVVKSLDATPKAQPEKIDLRASWPLPAATRQGEQAPPLKVQDQIEFVLAKNNGLTATGVSAEVAKGWGTKRDTAMSTLSRMKSKGAVRKEGKLYFAAAPTQ